VRSTTYFWQAGVIVEFVEFVEFVEYVEYVDFVDYVDYVEFVGFVEYVELRIIYRVVYIKNPSPAVHTTCTYGDPH
jgi:hypothetical protein